MGTEGMVETGRWGIGREGGGRRQGWRGMKIGKNGKEAGRAGEREEWREGRLEGRAGQGRAGQGRAGQGRAGQGRAGQGRAGQGRAGQGRAGRQGWMDGWMNG